VLAREAAKGAPNNGEPTHSHGELRRPRPCARGRVVALRDVAGIALRTVDVAASPSR
jgi:hypothetical protein